MKLIMKKSYKRQLKKVKGKRQQFMAWRMASKSLWAFESKKSVQIRSIHKIRVPSNPA